MRRGRIFILLGIFLVTFVLPHLSQETQSSPWKEPVQFRLKNGLRVILYDAPSVFPVVSVVLAYNAGFMYEKRGQTGLAFLMESLMFQGSENVGPLQHVSFVQKAGGELNALTTFDRTLFYQTLPSNQLALALWLESDRMKSLAISDGAFEQTRERLVSDQMARLDREPYFDSYAVFDEILFPDFPYDQPMIGLGEDLKNLTIEDARAFYREYYVPNNAVLCVAGAIKISETRELVSRYFDSIPRGKDILVLEPPRFEQQQVNEKFLQDPLARSPGFHMGYRFYPLQTGDLYSLRILEYVLLRGKTGRLTSRLVRRDSPLAFDLTGGLEERRGAYALKVFVINNNEYMADRSKRAILAEIERVKAGNISEAELRKAKNLFKRDYLRRLSTTLGRALFLVDTVLSDVPLESLPDDLDEYMRVPSQILKNFAQRYCVPENLVILNVGTK